uniref:J domain-containing protein n=1 Tax=Plectus sambesii TaxID=2011161 RepID=A0A914W4B4_9BILA
MACCGDSLRQRCLQVLLRMNYYSHMLNHPKNGMATFVHQKADDDALLKAYRDLGLKTDCSKEELKDRFVQLAKSYHPDTGGESADPAKFMTVKNAYKTIAAADYGAQDQSELNSVQEQFHDIKHTAPQHRQYLEYAGVGFGTPFERMKQYQQYRVQNATENARNYAVEKIARDQEENSLSMSKQLSVSREQAYFSKKQKTTSTIERMVEDMIQQSIDRGEFTNLTGMGQPLKDDNFNPYVDEMQHKLNKILINNGFSPPWILKEREIRDDVKTLRAEISSLRRQLPKDVDKWSAKDEERWLRATSQLEDDIKQINKAIRDFNLIAPGLGRQMGNLGFERELDRAETVFDTPSSDAPDNPDSHPLRPIPSTAIANSAALKSKNPEYHTTGFRSLLEAMNIRKVKKDT